MSGSVVSSDPPVVANTSVVAVVSSTTDSVALSSAISLSISGVSSSALFSSVKLGSNIPVRSSSVSTVPSVTGLTSSATFKSSISDSSLPPASILPSVLLPIQPTNGPAFSGELVIPVTQLPTSSPTTLPPMPTSQKSTDPTSINGAPSPTKGQTTSAVQTPVEAPTTPTTDKAPTTSDPTPDKAPTTSDPATDKAPTTSDSATDKAPTTSHPATDKAPTTSNPPTNKAPTSPTSHAASTTKPASVPPTRTTTVPAVITPGKTTTSTSTITDSPESTFSKPVSITVTAANGRTTVSVPPLITVLETSTEPNGSVFTTIHVVANPTGAFSDNQALNKSSLFRNQGAVAGVFLVVGIIVTAIVTFIFIFCRRVRRRSRRDRWIRDMTANAQVNRFRDSSLPPLMRNVSSRGTHASTISHGGGSASGLSQSYNVTGIGSGGGIVDYHGGDPFDDQNGYLDLARNRNSRASTPSLYPPSIRGAGEEVDSIYAQKMSSPPPERRASKLALTFPPASYPGPGGQNASSKAPQSYPLTPPASTASDSDPSSPISDIFKAMSMEPGIHPIQRGKQELYSKRTLLNVRPRAGEETVQS